jgi:signal transduction histidine kinase/ligand-binding sensor domain-containing protein
MKKLKILLTLVFLWITSANAQYQKPYFNTLSVQDGLPEAYVRSKLEDANGYLWLGTQNGLVRYDGYKLKNYPFYDENNQREAAPSINKIIQDKKGTIWVFTSDSGFFYYENKTDTFKNFSIDKNKYDTDEAKYTINAVDGLEEDVLLLLVYNHKEEKTQLFSLNTQNHSIVELSSVSEGKNTIPIKNPSQLIKDKNDRILLVADGKLYFYDEVNKSFSVAFTIPESLKNTQIVNCVVDPSDSALIWMSTYEGNSIEERGNPELVGKQFIKYNSNTKEYIIFTPEKDNPETIPSKCLDIISDSQNRLWFVSENGISLYNNQKNTFTYYEISLDKDFGQDLRTIESDKEGNVWVGGVFKKLFNFNISSEKIREIIPNDEEGSLPDFRDISEIFFDKKGSLWLNMPFSGIAHLDVKKSIFATQNVFEPLISQQKIDGNSNFSIVGKKDDTTFFVANAKDLFTWNSITKDFTTLKFRSDTTTIRIYETIAAPDGIIWIATGRGLFSFNPKTKARKHYTNNPDDTATVSSNIITHITLDKNGILWISTNDKGLCSLNTATDAITQYPFKDNTQYKKTDNVLDDERAFDIFVDDEDMVWVGTNNGSLNRYDPKTNKFKSYGENDRRFYCVVNIFEDSKKRLWVGTYLSGLFLFDRKTEEYVQYSEENGMLDNAVYSIQEDNDGNIWCSSKRGFSRLNPETKKITHFSKYNKDLNGYKDPRLFTNQNNKFFNNVQNGMMIFNPSDLQPNPIPPSVVIESLQYEKNTDQETENIFVYPSKDETITLKHNENKITFNYVALQYDNAKNNQYAYQLVGNDKKWLQAGTEQKTTYTNLSPGTYTFKVKAANSDGVWNETGTSITVKILPPWWKTWWAYCLYAIFSIGGIWFYIQQRSKALRRENLVLEEKVSHRTKQLEKSIDDLKGTQSQLIQSEKMASLGELTAGIAHEIQNPLNFVNNFSEVSKELLQEMLEEIENGDMEEVRAIMADVVQNLEKINHHGKRADGIVKGMLQHSRASGDKKEPTNINLLADEYLRLAYHGLRAKDKSFNANLETDFDENIGKINIIPQDIGRVILNLITNAFYACQEKQKSSPDSYKPTVTVTSKLAPLIGGAGGGSQSVKITVTDNGNGIPDAVKDKIFQPFFTTKPTGQGTGLGLSMSYDIITKGHGGELKVSSIPNEGSTFTIQIPINE